jgi:ribosome assembly protein RRB1
MPPGRARTSAKKKAGAPKKKGGAAAMDTGEPQPPATPAVWRPGLDGLGEGEALDYDPTAYDCLHSLALEWPCLR